MGAWVASKFRFFLYTSSLYKAFLRAMYQKRLELSEQTHRAPMAPFNTEKRRAAEHTSQTTGYVVPHLSFLEATNRTLGFLARRPRENSPECCGATPYILGRWTSLYITTAGPYIAST